MNFMILEDFHPRRRRPAAGRRPVAARRRGQLRVTLRAPLARRLKILQYSSGFQPVAAGGSKSWIRHAQAESAARQVARFGEFHQNINLTILVISTKFR